MLTTYIPHKILSQRPPDGAPFIPPSPPLWMEGKKNNDNIVQWLPAQLSRSRPTAESKVKELEEKLRELSAQKAAILAKASNRKPAASLDEAVVEENNPTLCKDCNNIIKSQNHKCHAKTIECRHYGCNATFPASKVRNHEKFDCPITGRRRELLQQVVANQKSRSTCDRCHQENILHLQNHRATECPERIVPCPNCNETTIAAKNFDDHVKHKCEAAIRRNIILKEAKVLNETYVTCTWCNSSNITSKLLQWHQQNECTHRERQCPSIGCYKWLPVHQIQSHLKNDCKVVISNKKKISNARIRQSANVPCTDCGMLVPLLKMSQHRKVSCRNRIVKCRNNIHGCTTLVRLQSRHFHEEIEFKDDTGNSAASNVLCFNSSTAALSPLCNVPVLENEWTVEIWMARALDVHDEGRVLVTEAIQYYEEIGRIQLEIESFNEKITLLDKESSSLKVKAARKSSTVRERLACTETQASNDHEIYEIRSKNLIALSSSLGSVINNLQTTVVHLIDVTTEDGFEGLDEHFHQCFSLIKVELKNPAFPMANDSSTTSLSDWLRTLTSQHRKFMKDLSTDARDCAKQIKTLKTRKEKVEPLLLSKRQQKSLEATEARLVTKYETELSDIESKLILLTRKVDVFNKLHSYVPSYHTILSNDSSRLSMSAGPSFKKLGLISPSKSHYFNYDFKTNPRGEECDDSWIHVAVTACKDKNIMHLYINGEAVDTIEGYCDLPVSSLGTKAHHSFHGLIQDVRIYSKYNESPSNNIDVPAKVSPNLFGYWPLEEGALSPQDATLRHPPATLHNGVTWSQSSCTVLKKSYRASNVCAVAISRAKLAGKARERVSVVIPCPTSCGEEEIKPIDLSNHLATTCTNRTITCPEIGCGMRYVADEEVTHRTTFCEVTMKREMYAAAHQSREEIVQCPFNCGIKNLKKKDVTTHARRDCPKRLMACEGCGLTIRPDKLQRHIEVECTNPELQRNRAMVARARERRGVVAEMDDDSKFYELPIEAHRKNFKN